MAAEPPTSRGRRARRTIALRAPSLPLGLAAIVAVSAFLAGLFDTPWGAPTRYLEVLLLAFLGPAVAAGLLTAPVARALGGRFTPSRAFFLALLALVAEVPLLGVARLWDGLLPARGLGLSWFLLMVQGPVLWFRGLSLFGISNPSHRRSLPPALLQPVATLLGFSVLFGWTPVALLAAVVFLVIGWLAVLQLVRATDRPLRREFQASGIALLRPVLDHIDSRDPAATEHLERFFARFAIPADLSATLLEFRSADRVKATIALPTVHPGPFAALGASNLPQKVAERLGPASGVVLVPHTPCNHELDLPTSRETDRVLDALVRLRGQLRPLAGGASPLVAGRPGGLARTQQLGDAHLTIVSQAPGPTDDIAFSVGQSLRERFEGEGRGPLLLIDGHNSYVEDQGDIAFGSTTARRLAEDVEASVAAAAARTVPGAIEAGAALRTDRTVGEHGIGPAGIRALVVRAAGRTTAYVLIDGNNLVLGARATILGALTGLVDDAEVMTTDNHIVHEVDGGTNPVGERYPPAALAADCRGVVEQAIRDLGPVEVRVGTIAIPEVPVLGPSWTERLLTSLGDTVSVFGHQAVTTLLLLLLSSLVVLVLLR